MPGRERTAEVVQQAVALDGMRSWRAVLLRRFGGDSVVRGVLELHPRMRLLKNWVSSNISVAEIRPTFEFTHRPTQESPPHEEHILVPGNRIAFANGRPRGRGAGEPCAQDTPKPQDEAFHEANPPSVSIRLRNVAVSFLSIAVSRCFVRYT